MPFAINIPWLEEWLTRLGGAQGVGFASVAEPALADDLPDALRDDLGLGSRPVDNNRNEIFWQQHQRLRRHGLPF